MSFAHARPHGRPDGSVFALNPVTPLMLLCLTAVPSDAGTRSAQMSVSVNVVRSCRISMPTETPAALTAGKGNVGGAATSSCSGAGEVVPMRSSAIVSRTDMGMPGATTQPVMVDAAYPAPVRTLSALNTRGSQQPALLEVRLDY